MTGIYDPWAYSGESVNGSTLHSALITQFLFGIYLAFWVLTLTIYCHEPSRRMIPMVLISLFILASGQVGVQWYSTTYTLVNPYGFDPNSTFYVDIRLADRLFVGTRVGDLLVQMSQGLADGLMVWRCSHVLAHRSGLRIMVICFYIIEIVCIVMEGLDLFDIPLMATKFDQVYNTWLGVTFLLTAITSVTASFMIGAQIYLATTTNLAARRRYSNITEILMQSSALYSLTIICQAVQSLVYSGNSRASFDTGMSNALIYIGAIMTFTTAFAPTLMVARLTMTKDRETESFTTNNMFALQDETLGAFVAQELEGPTPDFQDGKSHDGKTV